jgi:hypothetical protein
MGRYANKQEGRTHLVLDCDYTTTMYPAGDGLDAVASDYLQTHPHTFTTAAILKILARMSKYGRVLSMRLDLINGPALLTWPYGSSLVWGLNVSQVVSTYILS